MKNIRLLISDDHPVVRAGLIGMLSGEKNFEVVGEAIRPARRLWPSQTGSCRTWS